MVFLNKWGEDVTENLLTRMIRAGNVEFTTVFFNFELVAGDVDDNKFADLFIASQSDFIVSNDVSILALNKNKFPKFEVITLQEFSSMLNNN